MISCRSPKNVKRRQILVIFDGICAKITPLKTRSPGYSANQRSTRHFQGPMKNGKFLLLQNLRQIKDDC